MPDSIKTTCRALIIQHSLPRAQGWEGLCAFKSRWRWYPAPRERLLQPVSLETEPSWHFVPQSPVFL